jgi:hypothetical protein
MSDQPPPALTPQQWESRDYRQVAREIDAWARRQEEGAARAADATEYVAKLGLQNDAVIVMNRAHDRVVVPPPARPALAAFALLGHPFGFVAADAEAVERAAMEIRDEALASRLRGLSARLRALLPPG